MGAFGILTSQTRSQYVRPFQPRFALALEMILAVVTALLTVVIVTHVLFCERHKQLRNTLSKAI